MTSKLPSPPFIGVDGIQNFRDVGGLPLPIGSSQSLQATKVIRSKYLYRCGETAHVTAVGKQVLQHEGIATFFDLRSHPELAKAPAPDLDDQSIERQHAPVFPEESYTPEIIVKRYAHYMRGGPEGVTQAYHDILESAGPAYRAIMLHIRDHPNKPLVVHCTAGKDRTGVIIALLLSIAGVDDKAIAEEYALTDLGLHDWLQQNIDRLMQNPASGGDREKVTRMVSAKSENMLATLKMIRERYGSCEGYAKTHCGLSDHDLLEVAKNLTRSN